MNRSTSVGCLGLPRRKSKSSMRSIHSELFLPAIEEEDYQQLQLLHKQLSPNQLDINNNRSGNDISAIGSSRSSSRNSNKMSNNNTNKKGKRRKDKKAQSCVDIGRNLNNKNDKSNVILNFLESLELPSQYQPGTSSHKYQLRQQREASISSSSSSERDMEICKEENNQMKYDESGDIISQHQQYQSSTNENDVINQNKEYYNDDEYDEYDDDEQEESGNGMVHNNSDEWGWWADGNNNDGAMGMDKSPSSIRPMQSPASHPDKSLISVDQLNIVSTPSPNEQKQNKGSGNKQGSESSSTQRKSSNEKVRNRSDSKERKRKVEGGSSKIVTSAIAPTRKSPYVISITAKAQEAAVAARVLAEPIRASTGADSMYNSNTLPTSIPAAVPKISTTYDPSRGLRAQQYTLQPIPISIIPSSFENEELASQESQRSPTASALLRLTLMNGAQNVDRWSQIKGHIVGVSIASVRGFMIGWMVQAAPSFFSFVLRRLIGLSRYMQGIQVDRQGRSIISYEISLIQKFFINVARHSIRYGLFMGASFGAFNGIIRATSYFSEKQLPFDIRSYITGCILGPLILIAPPETRNTIALFSAVRAMDIALQLSKLRDFSPVSIDRLMFAISNAQLLYCWIFYREAMEPHFRSALDKINGFTPERIQRIADLHLQNQSSSPTRDISMEVRKQVYSSNDTSSSSNEGFLITNLLWDFLSTSLRACVYFAPEFAVLPIALRGSTRFAANYDIYTYDANQSEQNEKNTNNKNNNNNERQIGKRIINCFTIEPVEIKSTTAIRSPKGPTPSSITPTNQQQKQNKKGEIRTTKSFDRKRNDDKTPSENQPNIVSGTIHKIVDGEEDDEEDDDNNWWVENLKPVLKKSPSGLLLRSSSMSSSIDNMANASPNLNKSRHITWILPQRSAFDIVKIVFMRSMHHSFVIGASFVTSRLALLILARLWNRATPFNGWIGAWVGSSLSVALEKKTHRMETALFILPEAIRTLWNDMASRNIVPSVVPYGEVFLFGCAISVIVRAASDSKNINLIGPVFRKFLEVLIV